VAAAVALLDALDALVTALDALVDADDAEDAALVSLVAAFVAAVSAAALELVIESTSVELVPVPLKKLDFAICKSPHLF